MDKYSKKIKARQRYYRNKWKDTPFGYPDLWIGYFSEMIDYITNSRNKFNITMIITRKGDVELVLRPNLKNGELLK